MSKEKDSDRSSDHDKSMTSGAPHHAPSLLQDFRCHVTDEGLFIFFPLGVMDPSYFPSLLRACLRTAEVTADARSPRWLQFALESFNFFRPLYLPLVPKGESFFQACSADSALEHLRDHIRLM